MYKFIFDSDALIKLTKSGILQLLCQYYSCVTTPEVENECVEQGKKRLHKDALTIENSVSKGLVTIIDVKKIEKTGKNLGRGEISTVNLYLQEKNAVIVTDDSAFINFLAENEIKFLVPADLVLLMKISNKVDKKTALLYLDKLREFIRKEVYYDIKKEIIGG